MFTKISKIAKFILLVLFFTIGLLYVVFRSRPVQTWMVSGLSSFLSDELGTRVKIGGVDIDFFKTAVLENVFIEDQRGDTLFYFRKIKVDYNTYDKQKNLISLHYLGIQGGKVLFGEHRGELVNNYEFFIDYLDGGPRDTTKPKVIWTIYSKKVALDNVRFDFFNRNEAKPDFMDFNYNDMSFRNISGELNDFYLVDDSLHFQTRHLETTEKCGFRLQHLSADTKIHSGGIEFRDLSLQTPYSQIGDLFIMQTQNWKSYNDFNEKVRMKANLKQTRVDTRDLAYFTNNLKDWQTVIRANGSGEGNLSRLRGKNTEISVFKNTLFKGDWSLTGLPDFDNTILDFDVQNFSTDYRDLRQISLDQIPSNFSALGHIRYKGMFSGFYNDFITFGELSTGLGDFRADINIKFKEGLDKARYSGTLQTDHFQIRRFIPEARIDELAFKAAISGTGLSRNTYHMTVDAEVPALVFAGHLVNGIIAKGDISREQFSGQATVRDRNLDLDFDGSFRSDLQVPEAHFRATLRNANLAGFGLDQSEHTIKGDFNMDFKGFSLDDAIGSITGEKIEIVRNGRTVTMPYINLSAYEYNAIRELRLRSDLVDASVKGRFRLDKLDVSILHLLHQLIPAYFDMPSTRLPDEDFVFDFDLKNPYDLTSLYMPDMRIEPCKGKGFYQSEDQTLNFDLSNGLIIYNEYVIRNLVLNARKQKGSDLDMQMRIADFTDEKRIRTRDIVVHSTVFDNVVDFKISGIDTGYRVSIASEGRFLFVKDSIFLNMKSLGLGIENEVWHLDTSATALISEGKLNMENFVFRNQDQSLQVRGELGEHSARRMELELGRFSLKTLNAFLRNSGIPALGGVSEGKVVYSVISGQDRYQSALTIQDFSMAGDTFGDLSVFTSNQPKTGLQHLRVYVDKGLLDSLRLEGNIDYSNPTQNLDLYAHLPPTGIRVFEPYLKGVMSHMGGVLYTTDSLKIHGTFSKPLIEGDLELKNAELSIDYLKVPMRFSTRLSFEKERIVLHPCAIYDDKGNSGRVKGFVSHKNFGEFNINLSISELARFHVMNIAPGENEMFYGQAYANGSASVVGPFDDLAIKVNARTMPGTKFYLPISEGDASGLPAYVHFKTAKKKQVRKKEEYPLSLMLDIEATQDADVEIIFDEIMGDKITGTGSGNLKMEMSKSGDFYMFGTYTVSKGRYLFTAFDLYNKPFNIRPGGTITWYGDPLDARLDLVAYNSEKADPAPLLTAVTLNSAFNSGSSSNVSTQPVTAESELYLKGNLFSPEISFGLNFPKLQTEAGNITSNLSPVISRIKSDKEEVSRQVFSLLLMKKFLPPTFAQSESAMNNAGSNALSTAGTDLLSSQLSNWLNKIDPDWKVNVIYKNGSITLPPEYGVNLSSRFLNDKLSFDGSFSNYSTLPNINLEYKVTKKGNVKIKAYTRSSFNQVNTTTLSTPITTNGLGLVYTKEFNVFRWFRFLKRKKKK